MRTRDLVMVALMASATSVLAYVRIPLPFTPVPVTGQTFGVMLAGALLGPRLGALSMVVYVLLGAVGVPVFAGAEAGPGALAGPTGGYLFGFIVGSFVTGLLVERCPRSSTWYYFLAITAGGIIVVYTLGVAQLMAVTGLGLAEALWAGAVPFLPGDLLKAAVASTIAPRLKRVIS